jgi:hypothetical protein
MINIPDQATRVWQQPNASDLLGNLFVTKNITFDQQGYLTLSYSPRAIITQATANFNNVADMIHNTDYAYFIATWENTFTVNDAPLSVAPSEIGTGGVPSTDIQTGLDYVNALLVVSQDTDVDFYDSTANTWTDTNITLANTSAGQHPVVLMLSLNALAIANINTVGLYASSGFDATPDLITTLTIPSNLKITQMVYYNQNLYIATKNTVGGKAAMYVWNGQGTAAQQAYQIDCNQIFALEPHKGQIYALLSNGALVKFNGGDFDLAAGFPIYYTDMSLTDFDNVNMYKDIMRSNGEVLYINFGNNSNVSNSITSQPDGIWCYDERIGLYHRYANTNALVNIQTISTANVNTTTNQITVASPAFVTGTEVYYRSVSGTAIAGLITETKYFVIKIDATHIQLATTLADATAGTAIDLTGTGNAAQTLNFFPNIDYGAFYAARPTATLTMDIPSTIRQYGTDILWGTEVFRRDNTGDYGTLMTASTGVQSRGYCITPKIFSRDVTNNYDMLTLKWSPFISELDKIIIKYRTVDDMRNIINANSNDWIITWTSTTTFTVTPTTLVWDSAVVGDEIEILSGAGGGLLAQIVSITGTTTKTITIDGIFEQYITGDIGRAIFRNWKLWKTISYGDSDANQNFIAEHLGLAGQFLQLKIELRGVQTQIVELIVDDVFRLPAKDK